jgi:predicted nuclease of predicted toxin-antitoxin system
MRLLADENVPGPVVTALRQRGHDVFWIRSDCPGTDDCGVLRLSCAEGRVLLTFDKDFGRLVFADGLAEVTGVILVRLPRLEPEALAAAVVEAVSAHEGWLGRFSVIEQDNVRMTPILRVL